MSKSVPAPSIWIAIKRLYGARPGVIQAAKRELTKEKNSPEKWPLGEVEGAMVCLVNGDRVKRDYEMDFVEGGNGKVYDFIPKDELWVDVLRDSSTLPHITYHEAVEWWLMTHEGLEYDAAHKQANELEHARLESGQLSGIIAKIDEDARESLQQRLREDLERAERGNRAAYVARVWRRAADQRPLAAEGVPGQTSANVRGLRQLIAAGYGVLA